MKTTTMVIILIFAALLGGCGNVITDSPVAPVSVQPKENEGAPLPTLHSGGGIVGRWESRDGLMFSSGILMKDAEGHLYPLSDDRQLAVERNWLFKIDVEYFGSRGTIPIGGEDLPLFMRGDLMTQVVTIDYNGRLPLNLYPILYAQLNVAHKDESGRILRWSEWEENPLLLPPQSLALVGRDMIVDTTLYPPNQVIRMEMELTCVFYQGWFTLFVFDSEDKWFFGG